MAAFCRKKGKQDKIGSMGVDDVIGEPDHRSAKFLQIRPLTALSLFAPYVHFCGEIRFR